MQGRTRCTCGCFAHAIWPGSRWPPDSASQPNRSWFAKHAPPPPAESVHSNFRALCPVDLIAVGSAQPNQSRPAWPSGGFAFPFGGKMMCPLRTTVNSYCCLHIHVQHRGSSPHPCGVPPLRDGGFYILCVRAPCRRTTSWLHCRWCRVTRPELGASLKTFSRCPHNNINADVIEHLAASSLSGLVHIETTIRPGCTGHNAANGSAHKSRGDAQSGGGKKACAPVKASAIRGQPFTCEFVNLCTAGPLRRVASVCS